MSINKVAMFQGKRLCKVLVNNEWWFSVVDVCGALTDSPDAGAYWRKLKQRLSAEGSEVVTFWHPRPITILYTLKGINSY